MHANYQQLKHFCEIWLRAHTPTGHKQIEHNDRNKSVRPIKIFIIQTDYSTAKPFNLIDYKSRIKHWQKHQTKSQNESTRDKKRTPFYAVSMSVFFPYDWRRFFFSHWTNTVLLTTDQYKKDIFSASHLIAVRMVKKNATLKFIQHFEMRTQISHCQFSTIDHFN